jgi:hypothetical protein
MTTDIVKNIDQRLGELQGEISKLETARAALIGGTTPPPSPKARRARRKTSRPTPEVVPAAKLTTLLTGSDGMTTRELANTTHGDQGQILSLLRELEQADQVRRTGQRRGTRWHAITDRRRIAVRVAELERSKR